jgi:hypothetical protein
MRRWDLHLVRHQDQFVPAVLKWISAFYGESEQSPNRPTMRSLKLFVVRDRLLAAPSETGAST